MNRSLVEVLNEEKTLSDTTTSEYKEPKEDIFYVRSSYILKDLIKNRELASGFKEPREDVSYVISSYILEDLVENKESKRIKIKKMGLEKAFIILSALVDVSEFEDDAFQTLVKENPLEKALPKFIPTSEAIIRIKAYKEEIKKKLKKRNKEEYAKLRKLSLKPFDV